MFPQIKTIKIQKYYGLCYSSRVLTDDCFEDVLLGDPALPLR